MTYKLDLVQQDVKTVMVGIVPEIVKLASELIRIPSLSGQERPVMEFVAQHLGKLGFEVQLWPVEEDSFSVFARSAKEEPRVVLTTHLDVVPAPDELFNPMVRDSRLAGRGACDCKGIAAVMIAVAKHLKEGGREDVALLFVPGEEVDGSGAKAALEPLSQLRELKAIVNGEPTSCHLMTQQLGLIDFIVTARGVAGHSGYRHLYQDANLALLEVLGQVLSYDLNPGESEPISSLNIGKISGGVATNVVSDWAEARVCIRSHRSVSQIIEDFKSFERPEVSISVGQTNDPISLEGLPGFPTSVAPFYSDAATFKELGLPVYLYGPGDMTLAHTDRESISFDELRDGFLGYISLYKALCLG